jgi:hypothetical protein
MTSFTGNLLPMYWSMDEVCNEQLSVGLTFLDLKTINLQVAKEANNCQIYFSTTKSDSAKLLCTAMHVKVYATNSECCGWMITAKCVEEVMEHNLCKVVESDAEKA